MNRHIYGLTLFLFVVKIHFLLYWAFFAPINFYSTQEKLQIPNPPAIEIKNKTNCWSMSKSPQPDLQAVAVSVRDGSISANVDFTNLEQISDLSGENFVLHVFAPDSAFVWSGELRPATIEEDSTFEFKAVAPEFKKLDRKTNYYARIETLSEHLSGAHAAYNINQATPVLVNFDKNSFGK